MKRTKYLVMVFVVCISLFAVDTKQSKSLDVKRIESNIEKLKKSVQSIDNARDVSVIQLKKDPFVSPVISERTEIREDEAEYPSMPELILYGIVSDGNKALALIDDEVKEEGEFIGDVEVLQITGENVLLKQGNRIFPLDIKK